MKQQFFPRPYVWLATCLVVLLLLYTAGLQFFLHRYDQAVGALQQAAQQAEAKLSFY